MTERDDHARLVFRGDEIRIWSHKCSGRDTREGSRETARGFELAFARSGLFRLRIGRRDRVVHPNHVVAFHPGEEYRVGHPIGGADASTVISFRPDALAAILAEIHPRRAEADPARVRFPFGETIAPAPVALLHMELRRLLRDRPGDGAAIEAAALALSGLALRSTETDPPLRASTRADYAERIEHLKAIVYARRGEPLRLSLLAREAAFSPYHLTRVWRAMTGTTLHGYLGSVRLREALEPLAAGETDLTAIALRLGFSSHSHFSERFRAEFGVTPSGFRARHRRAAPRPRKTARS